MPRSDEAEWWFAAVYEAVKEIPHGKVTSYGHIALLLGYREYYNNCLSRGYLYSPSSFPLTCDVASL